MSVLTTTQVARRFPGVEPWMVRRLFDTGRLPQPARVGIYRVVSEEDLPAVEAALRLAGYLKPEPVAS